MSTDDPPAAAGTLTAGSDGATTLTCAGCGNGVHVSVAPGRLHEYIESADIRCPHCGTMEVRRR